MAKVRNAVFIFSIAMVAFLSGCHRNPTSQKATSPDSHLQSILSRGTIRCSYLVYPPYIEKDPNTGQLSGIFYDLMEEIGSESNLKIEWDAEVGYESIFPDVNSGRDDMFCGGLWPNASRARVGSFSVPVFYSAVYAWGRSNEVRFSDLQGIDDPKVRIAVIDGAQEDIIAKSDYPNATRVSLPQLSPFSQNFLNITSNKADITFAEPGIALGYLKGNPGSIKELDPGVPVRIFGNVLIVPKGDYELKEFIDASINELLYSGEIDEILKHYEPVPGVFLRVALPYQPEKMPPLVSEK